MNMGGRSFFGKTFKKVEAIALAISLMPFATTGQLTGFTNHPHLVDGTSPLVINMTNGPILFDPDYELELPEVELPYRFLTGYRADFGPNPPPFYREAHRPVYFSGTGFWTLSLPHIGSFTNRATAARMVRQQPGAIPEVYELVEELGMASGVGAVYTYRVSPFTVMANRSLFELADFQEGRWTVELTFQSDTYSGRFVLAPPWNDAFAAAAALNVSGTLEAATTEPGEPQFPGISSGQTAWWKWRAPSNGIVHLGFSATNYFPFVNVYRGTRLANLALVASNTHLVCYQSDRSVVGGASITPCGCHWRFRDHVTFHVQQGETYQIQADSGVFTDAYYYSQLNSSGWNDWIAAMYTNVIPGSALALDFDFTPAPENDALAAAAKLQGARTRKRVSNRGATREAGEPLHMGNGGSSVWFSWTAPASGRLTLSTNNIPPYEPPSWGSGSSGVIINIGINPLGPSCGEEVGQNPLPAFFPVFAAYTGNTIASLVPANVFPLELEEFPHAVGFDVVKGQVYRIAFDGNQGTTGDIPFHLALTKPAANNDFKNRIATRGIHVVASGFNAGATREAGEPLSSTNTLGKSVWWSWTAPVSGEVHIDVGDSDYLYPIGVYTGLLVSKLKPIAVGMATVTFQATAGQTYQICISDRQGVTGGILMRITAPIQEAPLIRTQKSKNVALLQFSGIKGQTLLLQKSSNGYHWTNVRSASVHKTSITFQVRPAPAEDGPFYRAIVVDYRP